MAAPSEYPRGFSIYGKPRGIAFEAALLGHHDKSAPTRRLKPFARGRKFARRLRLGRSMGGDDADRIVLQHAAAGNVAALRLLLAPGRDFQ